MNWQLLILKQSVQVFYFKGIFINEYFILFYISCKWNKETNVPHLLLYTKPYLIKAGTKITDVFLYFVRVTSLKPYSIGEWVLVRLEQPRI